MIPIRATLLVVDREPLVRLSLRQRLAREGHHVLEAESAAAAIKELAVGVDLLLLDYGLPDAGGPALLRRTKDVCPDTPIILMAAVPGYALEAKKHGVYHCLNKPFNLDDAAQTVEHALETARLRREVRALRSGVSAEPATRAFRLPVEGVNLEEVERQLLEQALERCGGNQTHAGRLLGINRDQVRYRVGKFGLSKYEGSSGLVSRRMSSTSCRSAADNVA